MSAADEAAPSYPGARAPDRRRDVDVAGLRIAVWEWGDAAAPPLLLAHGGFDFARTYDVFAPLLADAGWRVVSWDQRGHGDSEHAALYNWEADARDALAVLDSIGRAPIPVPRPLEGRLGADDAGRRLPAPGLEAGEHRRPALPRAGARRRGARAHEAARLRAGGLARPPPPRRHQGAQGGRLPRRAGGAPRPHEPAPAAGVAALPRRVGARRDPDGWRWKLDPTLRFGGFGPWRPQWALQRLPAISVPMLGFLASVSEPMGWDTTEEILAPYRPASAEFVTLPETGHFLHIERPHVVAERTLEFLAR
jgi:pimeloyl-ACP methyl ester carboxylesterase